MKNKNADYADDSSVLSWKGKKSDVSKSSDGRLWLKSDVGNFIDDEEKIRDFLYCDKEDFLDSYSYVSDYEWKETYNKIRQLIKNDFKKK